MRRRRSPVHVCLFKFYRYDYRPTAWANIHGRFVLTFSRWKLTKYPTAHLMRIPQPARHVRYKTRPSNLPTQDLHSNAAGNLDMVCPICVTTAIVANLPAITAAAVGGAAAVKIAISHKIPHVGHPTQKQVVTPRPSTSQLATPHLESRSRAQQAKQLPTPKKKSTSATLPYSSTSPSSADVSQLPSLSYDE